MDGLGWTPDEKGSQEDWDPFGLAHFPPTPTQKIIFPTFPQISKIPGAGPGPPVVIPIRPVWEPYTTPDTPPEAADAGNTMLFFKDRRWMLA